MKKTTVIISNPTKPTAKHLMKDDVWGKFENNKLIDNGMIVARSEEICPIFKDKLPYKSVTVVCAAEQESEVSYWLEYVHGGNSISKIKKIANGKIAIRSNYMCW